MSANAARITIKSVATEPNGPHDRVFVTVAGQGYSVRVRTDEVLADQLSLAPEQKGVTAVAAADLDSHFGPGTHAALQVAVAEALGL